MRTLLVACGNTLRGDDGVAHEVLRLIAPASSYATRAVHQLTPELAEEVARFSRVVFIDADAERKHLAIEPVRSTAPCCSLTHKCSPEEIVALASALFGFAGQAFVCRIPARNFSAGATMESDMLEFAQEAVQQISMLCSTVDSAARLADCAR